MRGKGIGGALRNHRIIRALGGFHGFFPSRGAQTPFAAGLEPDAAEVVAARGGEVEELAGYLGLGGGSLSATLDASGEGVVLRDDSGRFGRQGGWMLGWKTGGEGWGREKGALPATAWFPPSSSPVRQ